MLYYLLFLTFTTSQVLSKVSGSCGEPIDGNSCPNLTSVVTTSLQEGSDIGPIYVVFVPVTSLNLVLDNVCYTASSLPDDPNTLLLSISRVFSNGQHSVISYIIDQTESRSTRYGSPGCSFQDTEFARVSIAGTNDCDISIVYRCVYCGACRSEFNVEPPVYGISRTPRPISIECIELARKTILKFGFRDQEYITYPMIRQTRCI